LIHNLLIRDERPEDLNAICRVIRDAFAGRPESQQTEHLIVSELRKAGALAMSLVAEADGEIAGHVAFSEVDIRPPATGRWYGLGPLSVRPSSQRQGIGRALVLTAFEKLRRMGASGCVVLGDPNYYGKFGFRYHADLTLEGVPPPYFQIKSFGDEPPAGAVAYHQAFYVAN
jgi:predicted N-acetyltransferase YhbS